MPKLSGAARFVLFALFVCVLACGVAAWISLAGGHSFGTPEFATGQATALKVGLMAAVVIYLVESAT